MTRRHFPLRMPAAMAALALGLALGGCASLQPQAPEEAVRARADARWEALTRGDVKAAYELTAPSFRKLTTLEQYQRRIGGGAVTWKEARTASVQCEEAAKCTAKIKITAVPLVRQGLPPIITYVDEAWLLEDGKWWLLPNL